MIKALLIDLDGVIRLWPSNALAEVEARAGLPAGAVPRTAFAPDLLTPAIQGQISDEMWRQTVAQRLQADFPQVDAAQVVAQWSAPAGEVNVSVVQLMRRVRKQATVILVSNATSRLDRDLRRLGLDQEFDAIVNSSVVGWSKPQAEIYAAALKVAGTTAVETLFVDDQAKNVDAAIQLGIAGHVFVGLDPLLDAFHHHGLLADPHNT